MQVIMSTRCCSHAPSLPVALIIPLWKRRLENTEPLSKNESEADRTLVIHGAPVESRRPPCGESQRVMNEAGSMGDGERPAGFSSAPLLTKQRVERR